MNPEMEIIVLHEQGRVPVTVLRIKGEVTSRNYDQLQTQAEEVFEAGMRYMVLDFTGVTYMSSAGLRAIHAIYRMLKEAGDDPAPEGDNIISLSPYLKLLNTPPKLYRVISAVGFDRFLELHTDLEEVVASF